MSSTTTTLRKVAVVGVTGEQGSSVARALLQTHAYHVRGLTRNPSSTAATALKELGVEVVAADLDNGADGVAQAFEGIWAVYAYTVVGINEVQHGKTMVDAAVNAGVERFIWSSSFDIKTHSGGKLSSPIFENKMEVQRYLASTPLRATIVRAGNFLENLANRSWLRANDDPKSLALSVPILPAEMSSPWVWVARDLGEAVRVILKDVLDTDGQHVDGKTFDIYRQWGDFEELRSTIEEVSGLPTTFNTVSREQVLAINPGLELYCDLMQSVAELKFPDATNADIIALGAQFGTIKDWAVEGLPGLLQNLASKSQK